ncbi:MAG TPA: SDR family oxidoreductase [Pseudonocardiaceae bacterium]|nr:SDR family oxidoreductase [Pseudonocardiaceae bacterium]
MTSYFVTGATGFIGRRLVARLLARPDCTAVYALVRPGSVDRLRALAADWPAGDKVIPVRGDITEPGLGVRPEDLPERVDHVVHVAAIYDFTASAEANRAANVDGTRSVIEFAERCDAGWLHHMSSIAVAGDHAGLFTERDFDLGQRLLSPYHATKFESEKLVRETARVSWRVYRPAVVVGDARTGEMDKIDGPYYFLPLIARLAVLPAALPLAGPDLGATNVVPVDYVAAAVDHLMHVDAPSGSTYHLVSPRSQPLSEIYNEFARAAGAPTMRVTGPAWTGRLVDRLARGASKPKGVPAAVLAELGLPPAVLPHLGLAGTFDSTGARAALNGTGIDVPPFGSYAATLWRYWAKELDPDRARRTDRRHPLDGRKIMITGASSGIGRATAIEVASRGAIALLVARRPDELAAVRDDIEAAGGVAYCYPCDLTDADAVEALIKQVLADHDAVDMLVNNAGRSIRRSVRLSVDRMHDFERTMALNYFAPLRLTLGLLPHMRARRFGHIVNVTTMGLQTDTPRFAAYLASKAALDEFSLVAGRELLGDGVTFTPVRMPLVRTPMIMPTTIYRRMPSASPESAARMVVRALEGRPVTVGMTAGVTAELLSTFAPRTARLLAHLAYSVMPESAPEARHEPRRRPRVAAAAALTRLAWRAVPRRDQSVSEPG